MYVIGVKCAMKKDMLMLGGIFYHIESVMKCDPMYVNDVKCAMQNR